MKQIFVLMLLILAYAFILTTDYAHAAKHMVLGDHEVTINGVPHEEKVYVNGSLAYDNADGDRALNIKAQFETDGGNTLVFFFGNTLRRHGLSRDVPLHFCRIRWVGFNHGQFRHMQRPAGTSYFT